MITCLHTKRLSPIHMDTPASIFAPRRLSGTWSLAISLLTFWASATRRLVNIWSRANANSRLRILLTMEDTFYSMNSTSDLPITPKTLLQRTFCCPCFRAHFFRGSPTSKHAAFIFQDFAHLSLFVLWAWLLLYSGSYGPLFMSNFSSFQTHFAGWTPFSTARCDRKTLARTIGPSWKFYASQKGSYSFGFDFCRGDISWFFEV